LWDTSDHTSRPERRDAAITGVNRENRMARRKRRKLDAPVRVAGRGEFDAPKGSSTHRRHTFYA